MPLLAAAAAAAAAVAAVAAARVRNSPKEAENF